MIKTKIKHISAVALLSSTLFFTACTPEEQAFVTGATVGVVAASVYSYPYYYNRPYYYYGGRYYYGGYYHGGYYHYHGHIMDIDTIVDTTIIMGIDTIMDIDIAHKSGVMDIMQAAHNIIIDRTIKNKQEQSIEEAVKMYNVIQMYVHEIIKPVEMTIR